MKGKELKSARIMGIDSSSKSIALSIYDRNGENITLVSTAKMKFGDKDTMRDRLEKINTFIPAVFSAYGDIDIVVIEQTIYIQSPQTSRILSYIVGHIWGKCLEYCENVSDVPIMTWKSHIGYKNVSKSEKAAWDKEFGAKEAKKKAEYERKFRTMKIMREKIPSLSSVDDNDIMDAVAIGYWGACNVE